MITEIWRQWVKGNRYVVHYSLNESMTPMYTTKCWRICCSVDVVCSYSHRMKRSISLGVWYSSDLWSLFVPKTASMCVWIRRILSLHSKIMQSVSCTISCELLYLWYWLKYVPYRIYLILCTTNECGVSSTVFLIALNMLQTVRSRNFIAIKVSKVYYVTHFHILIYCSIKPFVFTFIVKGCAVIIM